MPRNPSKVQAFSVREFFERFPTEDACLEHLMAHSLRAAPQLHQVPSSFDVTKLADRPAYTCSHCGANVLPVLARSSRYAHATAYMVLRDLSVRHDAAWRER